MMQSSTELKCFKGLVYFYVVLLSVSVVLSVIFSWYWYSRQVGQLQSTELKEIRFSVGCKVAQHSWIGNWHDDVKLHSDEMIDKEDGGWAFVLSLVRSITLQSWVNRMDLSGKFSKIQIKSSACTPGYKILISLWRQIDRLLNRVEIKSSVLPRIKLLPSPDSSNLLCGCDSRKINDQQWFIRD